MIRHAGPKEPSFEHRRPRKLDGGADAIPHAVHLDRWRPRRDLGPAGWTADQVRLERGRPRLVHDAPEVLGQERGIGVPPAHARDSRSWALARMRRVFTVPGGIPRRWAASAVVSPSRAV